MKFPLLGYFFPILFAFVVKNCINTDSIRLEYGGPQDKPIPTMVFYVDSLDKSGLLRYTYRSYKIKRDCLISMEKKIQEFDSTYKIGKEGEVGYYNFIINKNGVKTTYISNNKINSRRLIYNLIESIADSTTKQKVLIRFAEISSQMWE